MRLDNFEKEKNWLFKEKYHGEKTDGFFADCGRLRAGEPLAYLIGSIPFLHTTIYLDSQPLIPRPETEFWVEKAIIAIKTRSSKKDVELGSSLSSNLESSTPTLKILDLCAGSGAIGVAVAGAIPLAHITFGELDPTHLPTIKKNFTENLSMNRQVLGEHYEIIESDLLTNLPGVYDFILTNPPYIDQDARTVDDSVTSHEPHLALFGGVGGMDIIKRIISDARAHLTPNGQLWIEHEPFQCQAIAELATTHGFSSTHHKDQYDTYRYSVLTPLMAQ